MGAFIGPTLLAPVGSVGNLTPASVGLSNLASRIAVLFVVEAVGATPTITWKTQGAIQNSSGVNAVSDANAAWFDLPYILPSTDTLSQAAIVTTGVGGGLIWLALATSRFFQRIRLVTTANTNVTYHAELYQVYDH